MKKDFLFNDFEYVTPKQWKQKIQVDLKGADYNETLLWKTSEDITVKPFYTKEDRTHREINISDSDFNTCQTVFVNNDEKTANLLTIDALKRGANSVLFYADEIFDYKKLLENINLKTTVFYFNFQFLNPDFVIELSDFINSKKCYFNIDIIGNLAKTGNWFTNLKTDHENLSKITKKVNNSVLVDASIYQNGGANIVQQLAYALAHGNEYLNYFGCDIAKQIHFNFSVGSNYFFEIAKLRAFRILWETLLKEYNCKYLTTHIFVQPSLRNKTLYDYNVNMLRTTSESMSAILGGADTVSNVSYDKLFHKPNEFGERISRNQLLILREESGFKNAKNIADGTYYIETLTEQLAEKALDIFKLIEQGDGFLKQLKEGIIQRKIEESANKEQEKFDDGTLVLLGTNKIQNEKDKMKNDLELYPFVKKRIEKTLIQPIIQKRLSEKLEQERLEDE